MGLVLNSINKFLPLPRRQDDVTLNIKTIYFHIKFNGFEYVPNANSINEKEHGYSRAQYILSLPFRWAMSYSGIELCSYTLEFGKENIVRINSSTIFDPLL